MNRNLLIAGLVSLASLFFWDTIFFYPIKLVVVLMHESGHAIAALLTGGSVHGIAINAFQGGITYTQGGNSFIILNAGYLGSSLIGALLLYCASTYPWKRYVAETLGVLILVEALIWIRDPFTIAVALGMSTICIFLGLKVQGRIETIFVQVTGTVCCLYAVYDIFDDILSIRRFFAKSSSVQSDAQALAFLTGVPAFIWGLLWIGIAVWMFVFTVSKLPKGERKEE